MSEMIERVAAALRSKAAEIDQRQNVHEADPMWFAAEYARAAIEAMREPTEAMTNNAVPEDGWWQDSCAEVVWANMIDAALTNGDRGGAP